MLNSSWRVLFQTVALISLIAFLSQDWTSPFSELIQSLATSKLLPQFWTVCQPFSGSHYSCEIAAEEPSEHYLLWAVVFLTPLMAVVKQSISSMFRPRNMTVFPITAFISLCICHCLICSREISALQNATCLLEKKYRLHKLPSSAIWWPSSDALLVTVQCLGGALVVRGGAQRRGT